MIKILFGTITLSATLRLATPIIIAAVGGSFSHKAGTFNIAFECFMLFGAFFGAYGSYLTGSPMAGALLAALGLADALTNDVLCGLGGNAAKVLGLERGDDAVAHFVGLADLLGLGDADLGVLVVPVLVGHDVLDQGHIKAAGIGVDVHLDVVLLDLVVLLDGNDDGGLDLLDQVLCGDAALVLQHGESFKKFVVRCCHFSGSSCNLLSIYVSQTGLHRRTGSRWMRRSPQR